jgi:PAS domain S-box-containing protein
MIRRVDPRPFLRSRTGSGFVKFAVFAAVLSAAVGYGFYRSGVASFTANKSEEKITALRLVDAFVTSYANLRGQLGADRAPVPATFRAHSIDLFNQSRGSDATLRLRWVGREGRSIATPPADPAMAEAIESFVGNPNAMPRSGFLSVGDEWVFRTVYPSVASQHSCVECHNRLQSGLHWQLNDVMGAFSIEVPAGPFLRDLTIRSTVIAILLFLAIAGVGLSISWLHYRQLGERETAQTRIAENEARFRDFAEAASDWFWEQDENLRISYVSDNEVARRAGSTFAGQRGKTRREVVTLGVSEEQWQAHEADLAARRPFSKFRFQRIDAQGGLRHVELNGRPVFTADGVFKGYRGTATDITAEVNNELELARRVDERTAELRRVQEELVRNERLSALGQFTATVAHELRNPLSAIRNTAFTIAEMARAHGLKLDRPISRMERSIRRCDGLIADLLEYTRMRELTRLRLPLEAWLAEVLDEQKLQGGIVLRRDFAAAGVEIAFDPERLRRVVINLMENAAQALGELPEGDGERVVTVSTRDCAGVVRIGIADNGPGIDPEILPRVFDPLFSTKSFGTGLGLPTVKQIVEQHGGAIEIASTVGRGTCALVTLPASPPASSTVAELAA